MMPDPNESAPAPEEQIEDAEFEEGPALPPPNPRTQGSRQLMAIRAGGQVQAIIPQGVEDAFRLAQAVANSGLAPKGMNRPDQILVAIMTGAELGVPPMQAIQGIAVINGRPSVWGKLAIGLVRRSGLMVQFKEWIEGDGENMVAHCLVQRLGEDPVDFTFSVEDAKTAKLWNKKGANGGDTPWVTYPKRMMKHRARGFAFGDTFPDVLLGLPLTEEAGDIPPAEVDDIGRGAPVGSGLASRLPGPQTTGFDPDHIDRELGTEDEPGLKETLAASIDQETSGFSPDEQVFLDELEGLLKAAKTPLEVSAIASTSAPSRDALGAAARTHAQGMIDGRTTALDAPKPKGKRK